MSDSRDAGPGTRITADGTGFAVYSRHASRIDLCLFDESGTAELARLPMLRGGDDLHRLFVAGARPGLRYGFRAEGVYSPDHGLWFDPQKLLVDPYALEIDRPYRHDVRLTHYGVETADLVPKAILADPAPVAVTPPLFRPGGLIYEIAVRPFTLLHPDVPPAQRGTLAALAHPAVLAHLRRLRVDAVELMPITAWIDERHLPPLGLANGWGYNPVTFMALDPRLVPGGWRELAETVAALKAEGISTILDLVFNHTGESDRHGATLSLRGLDNLAYYRHVPGAPGTLVNDTGCGNTLACETPVVRQAMLDTLRRFVTSAGVDGFRFDLAPILLREAQGFAPEGETARALLADPLLADRILIAEPWDIGPGGYQLGRFPDRFLEWNDRARDDLRRALRGDGHMTGRLATVLAGSSDIFARDGAEATRSVHFLAAHDGFTLADLVAYAHRHNEANGEDNRDGHAENFSWNNGVEGPTDDPAVLSARKRDIAAALALLFVSRGTLLLTAGDEGGRSQQGNNNAYAQDNRLTWLDWAGLDAGLVDCTEELAALRHRFPALSGTRFLTGNGDVAWLSPAGGPMTVQDWESGESAALGLLLATPDRETGRPARLAVLINLRRAPLAFRLPEGRFRPVRADDPRPAGPVLDLSPVSVSFLVEEAEPGGSTAATLCL